MTDRSEPTTAAHPAKVLPCCDEARQPDSEALRRALERWLGSTGDDTDAEDHLIRAAQDWLAAPKVEARQPDSEALRAALQQMVDEFDNKGDEDHGEYPALCTACAALDAAKAALAALPPSDPPALDVDLIQRVMFRLVGTSHVPDLDSGGIAFLAHREFAELFAAEYARLSAQPEVAR